MASTIVGASEIEQALYDYVSDHIETEHEIVDEYRALAERQDAPAFTFLARLILADEERHHALFAALAQSIRTSAELSGEEEPIPGLGNIHKQKDELLGPTERFLRIERQDLKDLKALAKHLHEFEDTTLWSVVVKSMQDDTRKHIRFLEFLRDRLRESLH